MNAIPPGAPVDAARIEALAARLDVAPRVLLAVATRIAQSEAPLDDARLRAEIERAQAASGAAEDAVNLLLLGHGAHAEGDLSDALAMVWSDRFASTDG